MEIKCLAWSMLFAVLSKKSKFTSLFFCPQGNQLQQVLTGPVISATMNLPLPLACSLLQQHVNAALQGQAANGKFF